MRERSCSNGCATEKLNVPRILGFSKLNALLFELRVALKLAFTFCPVGSNCWKFSAEFWFRLLSVVAPLICEEDGCTDRFALNEADANGSYGARAARIFELAE